MRFTQGQVRDLLDVDVETLRRWRAGVSALAEHRGHGPTYSPGDVVVLALIADLVRGFGVRVNTLGARLGDLFRLCCQLSWMELEGCHVLLSPGETRLVQAPTGREARGDETTLVIALRPLVTRLRTALVAHEGSDRQANLPFPPAAQQGGLR